jgi:hypothetical protein
MRYAVITASAAIPAAVWATWPPAPKPLVAKTVVTEGVREQRADTGTFRARWSTISEMPPAMVISHEQQGPTPSQDATGQQCCAPAWVEREASSPPQRRSYRQRAVAAHARRDICQQHKMHKVFYGRRWRCRR